MSRGGWKKEQKEYYGDCKEAYPPKHRGLVLIFADIIGSAHQFHTQTNSTKASKAHRNASVRFSWLCTGPICSNDNSRGISMMMNVLTFDWKGDGDGWKCLYICRPGGGRVVAGDCVVREHPHSTCISLFSFSFFVIDPWILLGTGLENQGYRTETLRVGRVKMKGSFVIIWRLKERKLWQ